VQLFIWFAERETDVPTPPAAICRRVGEISFISTAVVQTRTASKVPGRICLLPHQRHLVNGIGICLSVCLAQVWPPEITS
jgi:hypothetical protein